MTDFKTYLAKGKQVEEAFAENLFDVQWADRKQDMFEHWDLAGALTKEGKSLKFDVKGIKKIRRFDGEYQDDLAWVEFKNVRGNGGWVCGKADYIAFERFKEWLLVNREELLQFAVRKIQDLGRPKGRAPYHIFNRPTRKDELTLVPFEDMEKLKHTKRINKQKQLELGL